MILVDANLLLYAYISSAQHHERARAWLEAVFSTSDGLGLSWETILAFLRIGTSPSVAQYPLTVAQAVAIVSEWLERPVVSVLNPGPRHWEILRALLVEGQAPGPLVMDAHLAALAIEHGASLATTDRDFSRFSGLKFFNPLNP